MLEAFHSAGVVTLTAECPLIQTSISGRAGYMLIRALSIVESCQ